MRHRLKALAIALVADLFVMGTALAQPLRLPAMESLKTSETFQATNLSSAETARIFKQIEETSFDYPDSWQSELRVRRVSLGDTDGLVIQGTKLFVRRNRKLSDVGLPPLERKMAFDVPASGADSFGLRVCKQDEPRCQGPGDARARLGGNHRVPHVCLRRQLLP